MIALSVNGGDHRVAAESVETLQHLLHHRLALPDVRRGCGDGACGACVVLVDGTPRASCLMLASQAHGTTVVTASGLSAGAGEDGRITAAWRAFIDRAPFQCGYCAAGMSVSAAHHIVHGGPDRGTAKATRRALSGHLCRCTGYQQLVDAAADLASGGSAANDHVHSRAVRDRASGAARFPTDARPNTLVGRVVWSDFPAATILSIDTKKARRIPGVVAVLTHVDIPGANRAGPSTFGSGRPLLAVREIRSMADAIALVAAESEDAAAEAVRAIEVQYSPVAPVTDLEAASSPECRRVGNGSNTIAQIVEGHGDVEAALERADVIVTGHYTTEANDHGCLEIDGGTGWMEGDRVRLEVPHQTPSVGQEETAALLGIPASRVRIDCEQLGGSFGKFALTSVEGYLALLVFVTGRRIRLVLGRDEVLQRRPKRHPSTGRYRLGLDRTGKFVALDVDVLADAGPHIGLTPAVAAVIGGEASGAYTIPHVAARARGVLTNNLPTTPMRGYGSQQISFGVESIVERAAHEIGMDPIALRALNVKPPASDAGGRAPIAETLAALQARLGAAPAKADGRWLYGRGVALTHAKYGYPFGIVDRFAVAVSVDPDGEFSVECDLSDSGTAVTSQLTETVRAALGLPRAPRYVCDRRAVDDPSGRDFAGRRRTPLSDGAYRVLEFMQVSSARTLFRLTSNMAPRNVRRMAYLIARPTNFFANVLTGAKNALFPFGRESFQPRFGSSRASPLAVAAAYDAVATLRRKAVGIAAGHLRAAPSRLQACADGVQVLPDGPLLSWRDLVKTHGRLRAVGEAHNPPGPLFDTRTGNQSGAIDYMDAAHGCDIRIDVETGELHLDRYVACHDVGHVLNAVGARGQIIGGTVMGIGQALHERLTTKEGRVVTSSLREYMMPTALDSPGIEVELIESGTGFGPHGAKGIGESAAVAAPIAVANAIYDATGVPVTRLPVVPEDVFAMVGARISQ